MDCTSQTTKRTLWPLHKTKTIVTVVFRRELSAYQDWVIDFILVYLSHIGEAKLSQRLMLL